MVRQEVPVKVDMSHQVSSPTAGPAFAPPRSPDAFLGDSSLFMVCHIPLVNAPAAFTRQPEQAKPAAMQSLKALPD